MYSKYVATKLQNDFDFVHFLFHKINVILMRLVFKL